MKIQHSNLILQFVSSIESFPNVAVFYSCNPPAVLILTPVYPNCIAYVLPFLSVATVLPSSISNFHTYHELTLLLTSDRASANPTLAITPLETFTGHGGLTDHD